MKEGAPIETYSLKRVTNLESLWPEIQDFLIKEEATHNLLLGLLVHFVSHPESQSEIVYAAVIRDKNQEIVMVALQTENHNVILSQSIDVEPVDLLVKDLSAVSDRVPGVLGPQALSLRFASGWHQRTGRRFVVELTERIHELTEIAIESQSLGIIRQVQPEDRDWVMEWLQEFVREALPHQATDALQIARRSARKIDGLAREGGFFVLEVDGDPCSLVGYGNPTLNGIRVAPVYTPPSARGHGYATELVRAVSQNLLNWGYQQVYLFTDLKNLTSNRIYRMVGYRPVADVDSYAFLGDVLTP